MEKKIELSSFSEFIKDTEERKKNLEKILQKHKKNIYWLLNNFSKEYKSNKKNTILKNSIWDISILVFINIIKWYYGYNINFRTWIGYKWNYIVSTRELDQSYIRDTQNIDKCAIKEYYIDQLQWILWDISCDIENDIYDYFKIY